MNFTPQRLDLLLSIEDDHATNGCCDATPHHRWRLRILAAITEPQPDGRLGA